MRHLTTASTKRLHPRSARAVTLLGKGPSRNVLPVNRWPGLHFGVVSSLFRGHEYQINVRNAPVNRQNGMEVPRIRYADPQFFTTLGAPTRPAVARPLKPAFAGTSGSSCAPFLAAWRRRCAAAGCSRRRPPRPPAAPAPPSSG